MDSLWAASLKAAAYILILNIVLWMGSVLFMIWWIERKRK